MNLREFDITRRYAAKLVSTTRITPRDYDAEVRHLVLELPNGGFSYIEGQSIGVLAPGPHAFGNPYHFRLYSIASPREGENGREGTLSICVRRCFYIDDVSGERYPGKASNFLCDALPGDAIPITGPYGSRFQAPDDEHANLLMVGTGTGIAPFRAFVKHIFDGHKTWKGQVRLFYGAKVGMEALYMNDLNCDLGLYYDKDSYQSFEALSPRPAFDLPPDLERAIVQNSYEVWEMVQHPKTYVYMAGLTSSAGQFEKAMAAAAGSPETWEDMRAQLVKEGRFAELLYE
jgi:ferredoxin--NADP+ reductase